MVAYLVAVNPDLTPKWDSTLQQRLTDGCGVLLPIAANGVTDMPNSCRFGTTMGVDPTTNAKGSGTVSDEASSSPTVLPDGSIVFGTTDNYNYSRGHLFHFDARGNYLNSYTFGWDSTAGAFRHDGTFSIVIKDNHYPSIAYCSFANPVCAVTPPGPYLITQLDANLKVEWSFQSTTIDSLHPNGYEWCVNAPVIDADGVVYVTSEDGHIYSLPQGHKGIFKQPKQRIFLKEALGAAYTPLSIGEDGTIYSQNDGHLYLVGRRDE
jgi:outer membrane protein assembly factor BamB